MIPLDRLNDGLGSPGNVLDELGGVVPLLGAVAVVGYLLLGGGRGG